MDETYEAAYGQMAGSTTKLFLWKNNPKLHFRNKLYNTRSSELFVLAHL